MIGDILRIRNIWKVYRLRQSPWRRLLGQTREIAAVDGVSLSIQPGSILGLVGESGCGKSTLARMIVGLTEPSSGDILWRGQPLATLRGDARRAWREGAQMVFQDTHSSLNPRKRIRTIIGEALAAHGVPRAARPAHIAALLDQVGLDHRFLSRYPHELSGGQRQRIGIARALAMRPSLLVADEPVSSLDVSLQGQIINLLRSLNESLGLTIVLISHDLAVVARVCGDVAVMYGGQIVEAGPSARVLSAPAHPYTQALLDAVPRGLRRGKRPVLPVEAQDIAIGCRFQPRCSRALDVCREQAPGTREVGNRHSAACHLAQPEVVTGLLGCSAREQTIVP
jgi:peptide/nickel transport system ATP-binding protein